MRTLVFILLFCILLNGEAGAPAQTPSQVGQNPSQLDLTPLEAIGISTSAAEKLRPYLTTLAAQCAGGRRAVKYVDVNGFIQIDINRDGKLDFIPNHSSIYCEETILGYYSNTTERFYLSGNNNLYILYSSTSEDYSVYKSSFEIGRFSVDVINSLKNPAIVIFIDGQIKSYFLEGDLLKKACKSFPYSEEYLNYFKSSCQRYLDRNVERRGLKCDKERFIEEAIFRATDTSACDFASPHRYMPDESYKKLFPAGIVQIFKCSRGPSTDSLWRERVDRNLFRLTIIDCRNLTEYKTALLHMAAARRKIETWVASREQRAAINYGCADGLDMASRDYARTQKYSDFRNWLDVSMDRCNVLLVDSYTELGLKYDLLDP